MSGTPGTRQQMRDIIVTMPGTRDSEQYGRVGLRGMVMCGISAAVAGAAVFFFLQFSTHLLKSDDTCIERYPLTNPYLDCALYDNTSAHMDTLEHVIADAAQEYKAQGSTTAISVWVRDLRAFQVAAENPHETYSPASMMKVPIMIAYFRFAEVEPSILDQALKYEGPNGNSDALQTYRPETLLKQGEEYAVSALIEEMITNSDNRAADVLLAHMDMNFFKKTLVDLGIIIPANTSASKQDFVTVKTYANIYRMLFNASYLNREYSEKALELLTRTKFRLLTKKLPDDVLVASKFGERVYEYDNGTVKERGLHDCGIVYKKDHPYSICIMTKGNDFEAMQSVISDISKKVYDAI